MGRIKHRRKRKKTKRVHKRGTVATEIMDDVTNWSGKLLKNETRKKIKVGDIVRIIYPEGMTRYIYITDILGKQYLKGRIDDPYNACSRVYCNICDDYNADEKYNKKYGFYSCWGDEHNFTCDFHCHKKCIPKINEINKPCSCPLQKIPYQNGEEMVFKRNCISEIPEWSDNTRNFTELYSHKSNKGYLFTGVR